MNNTQEKSLAIGKIVNLDFEFLAEFRRSLGKSTGDLAINWDLEKVKSTIGLDLKVVLNYYQERGLLSNLSISLYDKVPLSEEEILNRLNSLIEKEISKLKKDLEYSKRFNNPFKLYFYNNDFVIIGFNKTKFLLPTAGVTFEIYKTYDEVKPSELLGAIDKDTPESSNSSIYLPDGTTLKNLSKKELTLQLEQVKNSIKAEETSLENQLGELRAQLRKKEENLMLQMESKVKELELKKKEFETQIFGLDHQLYLLRCLLGDSIEVVQLRKGKESPVEQPVILYQKLRFLDEDLAKIKTLYCHYFGEDLEYVEEIFEKDDLVFEQFCPNTKCVTLFRISKDSTVFHRGENGNSLEKFEYYNGPRIGILIRNGDNLYLVWTEEERIYLKENFIFNPNPSSYEVEDSKSDLSKNKDYETIVDDDYTNTQNIPWVQYFSRRFLMAILQGLVEYKKILKFPEKVSFTGPGPYIIFSTADNQIIDNRFGTLTQFMSSRNILTREDDYVLPIQSISGSYTEKSGWGNSYYENHSRGRGLNNRVRGCKIEDKVTQINLVEIPSKRERLYNALTIWDENLGKIVDIQEEDLTGERKAILVEYQKAEQLLKNDKGEWGKDRVKVDNVVYSLIKEKARKGYVWKENGLSYRISGILKETFFTDRLDEIKYYVSVEKPREWDSKRKEGTTVNSRVQIYKDEFINLTYLSSSVLKYFIESKEVGNYFGNYAYAVKYLNKALDFIRNRENEEIIKINRFLSKDISKIYGIDLVITDWKFNNRIRNITDHQAKRFANYFENIGNLEEKVSFISKNVDWIKK